MSAAFTLLTGVPLKCSSASRKHHLLKTFWGWHDRQGPDGTVVWTSPNGQTYTTHPGSRLLFPTLCRPTAAVARVDVPAVEPNRTQKMPRRKATRAKTAPNASKPNVDSTTTTSPSATGHRRSR